MMNINHPPEFFASMPAIAFIHHPFIKPKMSRPNIRWTTQSVFLSEMTTFRTGFMPGTFQDVPLPMVVSGCLMRQCRKGSMEFLMILFYWMPRDYTSGQLGRMNTRKTLVNLNFWKMGRWLKSPGTIPYITADRCFRSEEHTS